MKNKKKLGKMIALSLMLCSFTYDVTEAYSVYGNSPSLDLQTKPSGNLVSASGYTLDFHDNDAWDVVGGYAINADSSLNVLKFNGGHALNVYAGYSENGNANDNRLEINGGNIDFHINGGYSSDGNATGNAVTINDGNIDFYLSGGCSSDGNATGNIVNVNGGNISSTIGGGNSYGGNANDNVVAVNGGNFNGGGSHGGTSIKGGGATYGNANNNIVNVKADVNDVDVYGGYASWGNSDNNVVNITSVADNMYYVYGGCSFSDNSTGEYSSSSNEVFVDANAHIKRIVGGDVFIRDAAYKISSNDNKIIINNGTIEHDMDACAIGIDSSYADDESYVNACNNEVILNNGTVRWITLVDIADFDGAGTSILNKRTPIKITDNNLTINGGSVEVVYGIADSKVCKSDLIVKNNAITINGGTHDHIRGGHFVLDDVSTIESINNTVNWHGGDIENIDGYTYYVESNGNHSEIRTLKGSTFNFFASNSNRDKRISSLGGFENYHFYLDNTVPANTTLINLTGYADLSGSNVGVAVLGSSPLQEGDSVMLLSSTSQDGGVFTSPNLTNDTSHMTVENISTVYDFTLRNEENKKLIATVSRAGVNPKAENLMEARAAEAFMTYDKVDVVDKAYQASKHTSEPSTFIEYGYSDVTTKDDTKLRGSNVLWGIASTIGGEKDQANTLTRGIFFEYGDGTFSSIGHYPTGSIYGYGKSKKFGLGVLARKVMFDRHYYDAYLRAGTIKTDYDALAEGVGNIKYDNRDMYVSGNLGYGQFIQLTPNLQMDTYIKYFYNRIPGHSTTAYTNGVEAMPISFDVFENHRFRLGSKFTWDYMESNNYKWYADVALEQEFARDQSGSINSHRISKSNGSSTTGIIELCYENKFGVNDAFMFTAKAQGYVGDRRGLGASANLSFSF